jgi:uncharacterized protein YvpB/LysM repeat protein
MVGTGHRWPVMAEAARGDGRGLRRDPTWCREPVGIVGIYAARASDRGADLRDLINERRGALDGVPVRSSRRVGMPWAPRGVAPVGRGTIEHRTAITRQEAVLSRLPSTRSLARAGRTTLVHRPGMRRRLVVAGIAALLVIAGAASTGLAREIADQPVASPQHRYVVQPGDSLDVVSETFGVDPAAIVAASSLRAPAALSPSEIIVIPAPGESPAEAAQVATEWEGLSAWVADAYVVQPGDTLADIALARGVDLATLAATNGLDDLDSLSVGQRLLIPPPSTAAVTPAGLASRPLPDPASVTSDATAGAFIDGVPTHVQERNLSCEYAAAFIATSAFGMGVDEWTFMQSVPTESNPHVGFRGNIDGWWGNTDDYGVYPEALVPTLHANGFAADVLYTQGDAAVLRQQIDAGHPLEVWLGYWGDDGFYQDAEDGSRYKLVAGYHVVVAYGYDESGVYISDPARGDYGWIGWNDFTAMWSVLDGMSLAIYPA